MKLFICIIAGIASTVLADNDALIKASNDVFTANMFQEVVKNNPDKSVILSAFSVLPPLAQLAVASNGPSHDELLAAIGLPNDDTIKEVFSKLNKQIRGVKGVTLNMASKIYVANDAKLNKDFGVISRDVFGSDVENIDFSKSEQSANTINSWVEQHTNNKIKKLVKPEMFDGQTRSALVNAIYFKGNWSKKFDSAKTKDKDFHVSKSKTVKVPTMSLSGGFSYGESSELDAKLLELPYEGNEASFLIVLPNEVDGLANMEKKLKDPSLLNAAIQQMHQNTVDLSLPKFKIETTTDLKDVLQKMKVTKLFKSGEAKLDKLLAGESNLFVSDAIQKAFIEVNEEGAEATAANVIMGLGSSPLDSTNTFTVDRPFYFEVRFIKQSIFTGAIVEL